MPTIDKIKYHANITTLHLTGCAAYAPGLRKKIALANANENRS
jgi:hypothetical protein